MKGIFITATGTDTGKTFVSAALLLALRSRGIDAAYFKPLATGGGVGGVGEDEAFVRKAAEVADPSLCSTGILFSSPVSPHLAARKEKRLIELSALDKALQHAAFGREFILVEGAGGLAVPIDEQGGLIADLPLRWNLPCLLVADAGLGTINHTALSASFARARGITVSGVLLNRGTTSEIELDNAIQIERVTGLRVFGILPKVRETNGEILRQHILPLLDTLLTALIDDFERRCSKP